MIQRVVLLSGPVAAGKSSLGDQLIEKYGAARFKTNGFISQLRPKTQKTRRAMQMAGESLDHSTGGRWVKDALVRELQSSNHNGVVVVDSVRIKSQIDAIREAYGRHVTHIHLTASDSELERRYKRRRGKYTEFSSYAEVRQNPTERAVKKLQAYADVVIHTDLCREQDVLARAAAYLDLYPRTVTSLVDVIIGGQYGSEGKGNIASYIAPEYKYLVRVGGPNAGHKVFGDPPFTFHHLPSGTLASESAKLLIGAGAVISVPKILKEISECGVAHDRLTIDPQAMIITPKDVEREQRRLGGISSTAQGVGEATARRINDRALYKNKNSGFQLARDVPELSRYVGKVSEILEQAYYRGEKVLLEGTQGTSLSMYHGHYPWVTSRDTAVSGCLAEAGVSPRRVRKIVMVCRTYPIRVGGPSGPMSKLISKAEIARRSGVSLRELRKAERTSTTNKPRRFGEFDWEQLHRSTILNAPTDIALSFVDYLQSTNRNARRFDQLDEGTIQFIEEVERVSGCPVSLISTRFHYRCIIDRRAW